MLEISLNCDSNSNTCKSVFDESHQIYYIHGHPSSYQKPHASACGATINKIASAKLIMIFMPTFHVQ